MENQFSKNEEVFGGIALIVFAWHISSVAESFIFFVVLAVALAIKGSSMIFNAYLIDRNLNSHRPSTKVPPTWLICWTLIIVPSLIFGTPHLRYKTTYSDCRYVGWEGQIIIPNNDCDAISWFQLGYED